MDVNPKILHTKFSYCQNVALRHLATHVLRQNNDLIFKCKVFYGFFDLGDEITLLSRRVGDQSHTDVSPHSKRNAISLAPLRKPTNSANFIF